MGVNIGLAGFIVIAAICAVGIIGMIRTNSVYERGAILSQKSEPALFAVARARLLLSFVAAVCAGLAFASGTGALALGEYEKLLLGLAFAALGGVASTWAWEGFLTGKMEIGGAEGKRGEPDFLTIGAILIAVALLFGGIGLSVVIGELL